MCRLRSDRVPSLSPRSRSLATALSLVLLTILAAPAGAQQSAPPSCDSVPGFHQLDFWVGEWDVVDPDGEPQGTNRIEKILSGCAIMEHWEGAGGSAGASLFYYDHLAHTWKQVWVTERATAPGGVKEKRLVEELPDGGLRFQGVITRPDGHTFLDRTTLTPLDEGRVQQVIETSTDGGAEWQRRFVGIYLPRDS